MDAGSQHINEILTLLCNRFQMTKKISSGSFGIVYLGKDTVKNRYVAIKIEKDDQSTSSIEKEVKILAQLKGIKGVPKIYYSGIHQASKIMVMQLLGRDLAHIIKKYKQVSLRSILNIGYQLLGILENVHNKGILHRDLKPENILLGLGKYQSSIFLVDYGISKSYVDKDGHQLKFSTNRAFIGTTRYASLAAHLGYTQSRKDDLEALFYVIVFSLKGHLPWQNIKKNSNNNDRIKLVGDQKLNISTEDLCQGIHPDFQIFFNYIKTLQYGACPNYDYLKKILKKIASEEHLKIDSKFEWQENTQRTTKKPTKKEEKKREKHEEKELQKKQTTKNLIEIPRRDSQIKKSDHDQRDKEKSLKKINSNGENVLKQNPHPLQASINNLISDNDSSSNDFDSESISQRSNQQMSKASSLANFKSNPKFESRSTIKDNCYNKSNTPVRSDRHIQTLDKIQGEIARNSQFEMSNFEHFQYKNTTTLTRTKGGKWDLEFLEDENPHLEVKTKFCIQSRNYDVVPKVKQRKPE